MTTEGTIYERLDRLLRRKPGDTTGSRMINSSGLDSWAVSCLAPTDTKLFDRSVAAFGNPIESPSNYVSGLRSKLLESLGTDLDSVDDQKNDWRRSEKVARIGFPLHLRLLLDEQGREASLTWQQVGGKIANDWGLPPVAASAWLWHQMFSSKSIRRHEVVSTRTIATTQLGGYGPVEGVGGTLSVGQIDWPDDIEPPESRFVPHPESFSFCLDHDFVESLESCHSYLSEELKLWPDDVVLEWNLSLDQPDSVPVLNGGSAGAALTLAAGSLLAKRHLQSSGSS